MGISGLYINVNLLLRWFHVLAGMTWIGQLYLLDFVITPAWHFESGQNSPAPMWLGRVLGSLRWAAMVTFAAGIGLLLMNYFYTPGAGFGPTPLMVEPGGGFTDRATWLFFGMALAAVMWFNVWFVLWPAQKKLIRGGEISGDEAAFLRRRSARSLRTTTILSGPMLFGMLAPAHYGAINLLTWLLAIAIGVGVVWAAIAASRPGGKCL